MYTRQRQLLVPITVAISLMLSLWIMQVQAETVAAGVTVTLGSGITSEDITTDMFQVVLTEEPTATVTISLTSSITTEGIVSPAAIIFTTANWAIAQTATITGVDDMIDDGDQVYTITTVAESPGTDYHGITVANIPMRNLDNDMAAVLIHPTEGLITTEEPTGTATFTITLTSEPTATVTISLTSSITTEGTVSPASVMFTDTNWGDAQIITVTGVDDMIDDGDQVYTITTSLVSTDPVYNMIDPADVSVTNIDNEFRIFLPMITKAPITTETEPNNVRSQANGLLSSGVAVSGGFLSTDDPRDYYKFELTATGPVSIQLVNIPAGNDYDLYLRRSDGSLIVRSVNTGNADESISMNNLVAGTYYVHVTRFQGTSTQKYQMTVNY